MMEIFTVSNKNMLNKFICLIFGHLEGSQEACPYTLYTYISCIRCNEIYYAYPAHTSD